MSICKSFRRLLYVNEIKPYQVMDYGKTTRSGGLAIIYRDRTKVKRHACCLHFKPSSFEIQIVNVVVGKVSHARQCTQTTGIESVGFL